MASNAEPSTSNVPEDEGATRPQAGPLPRKRGEIGFRESVSLEKDTAGDSSSEGTLALPERHPADTQLSTSPTRSHTTPTTPTSSATTTQNDTTPTSAPRPLSSDASSMHKSPKGKFLSFFGFSSKLPKLAIGGISIGSFIRLFIQLFLLGGTLAAWIIITINLLHGTPNDFPSSSDNGNDNASDNDDDSNSGSLGGSADIFVHVTFAIAVLGQLLFLERCIYHIRAQRYAFKHPGATLPTHGSTSRAPMGMGFAPWSRPPLPTYAAALAQSGLGTGDVEDNLIAIPPPPAYGNTRGSTLLLRGFLRNSLREAISTRRDSSDRDEGSLHRMSDLSHRSRPVSYRTQDGDAEERSDAERALRLAEALQQLEDGTGGNSTMMTRVPENVSQQERRSEEAGEAEGNSTHGQ